MDLVKTQWQVADIQAFEAYLFSLRKPDKVAWTQKIVNTQRTVLAIPTPTLRAIAKKIRQGNWLSFLDLRIFSTHESIVIHGIILSQISDLALLEKYLVRYADDVDNWAACDLLSFRVQRHETEFLNLSRRFVQAENLFLRRIGLIILFKLVNADYIDDVLAIVDSLQNETEYYVNMAVAWLLCDCWIKQREKTWIFVQSHALQTFVAKKFVSKCRDSYRVSVVDKQLLNDYLRSKV